jgi:hypothetical protein
MGSFLDALEKIAAHDRFARRNPIFCIQGDNL